MKKEHISGDWTKCAKGHPTTLGSPRITPIINALISLRTRANTHGAPGPCEERGRLDRP